MSTCVFKYDYNTITANSQDMSVNGQTVTPTTKYRKSVLDKISKGLFKRCLNMLKNGATHDEVWQYHLKEITRTYKLKKMKRVLFTLREALASTLNKASIHVQRARTRAYRSASKVKTTRSNSSDSGDSDQPADPPARLFSSFNAPLLTPQKHNQNRSYSLRCFTPCYWRMVRRCAA